MALVYGVGASVTPTGLVPNCFMRLSGDKPQNSSMYAVMTIN